MNTRRMNRLEELGRVDAEKAFTKKGARNLRDEKKRIVRELKADGGKVKNKKKKPIRKISFEAMVEAATEKNRNPMKDQRLDDSIGEGYVTFRKAKGGSVPEKKIKKTFPKMTAKQRARLQTRLGDRTAPMKKERLKKADGGRAKMPMKKIKDIPGPQFTKDPKRKGLKPVNPSQKGLKKLPTKVRNKMGYMKKGGRVGMGKALRGGGCVR